MRLHARLWCPAPLPLAGLIVALGSPSIASAAVPQCMGHKATIVLKPQRIQIRGTSGPDVIVANDRPNFINGKGGNDIICARGRGDVVRGGAGNDILSTGSGNDTIRDDRGNDVVLGR